MRKKTLTVKLTNKLGKDYQTRATQCANITDLRSDQEHPINNRKYS